MRFHVSLHRNDKAFVIMQGNTHRQSFRNECVSWELRKRKGTSLRTAYSCSGKYQCDKVPGKIMSATNAHEMGHAKLLLSPSIS